MARFIRLKCFVVACLVIMGDAVKDVTTSCKTNESHGPTKHCVRLCGDVFMGVYEDLCHSRRKRERDTKSAGTVASLN